MVSESVGLISESPVSVSDSTVLVSESWLVSDCESRLVSDSVVLVTDFSADRGSLAHPAWHADVRAREHDFAQLVLNSSPFVLRRVLNSVFFLRLQRFCRLQKTTSDLGCWDSRRYRDWSRRAVKKRVFFGIYNFSELSVSFRASCISRETSTGVCTNMNGFRAYSFLQPWLLKSK